MEPKLGLIALLMTLVGVLCFASHANAEADPFVDEMLYSTGSTESTVLIQSGRDNATFYRYLIIDDYSESPENWSQPGFNDSNWLLGAAPFGDRSSGGVEPNIIWDTSGSSPYNDDVILIRHKFQVSGIVTSAELDVAVANFCTPYLNGNMIYDDRGGDSRAQEYWNDDAAGTITPSSFNQGENVLAVYARDYVGGWGSSNRQWIDLQLTAQVFDPTNESIIFGDSVSVAIGSGNKGNLSATNFTLNITANNSLIEAFFYETVAADGRGTTRLQWTPELVGLNQLNVTVSCDCNDTNQTNNMYTLNLTTVIYSLSTTLDTDIVTVNQSRLITKLFLVENTGDLTDNVTLSAEGEIFNNWNVQFNPNNFLIEPEETQIVTVSATIPNSYEDGYYNLSFKVESEYNYVITKNLLNRGAYEYVDWKWINSTGSEELYNNTNWTKLGFNDTSWGNASTPFGDDDLSGIDYRTFWDGNNYGYFRHIVDIPDIGLYVGGFMTINVATNNYGDHYINGIKVFGDIDGGNGHGAEYWNTEYQVYINYLNQGPNVIASIVSNPSNTQWFDQEIIMTFPQANLWNYKTQISNIPIYLDATAPTSRVLEEGFYRNNSTFEVKWRSIADFEDLVGYYIYYLEKDGGNLGDWTLLGFYTNESINFTGQGGLTYRFKSIAIDSNENIENKGTYDTEMRIDLDLPMSTLWLIEGDLEFTNLEGVTLQWKANDTTDIQAYLIEYRIVGNSTWNDFGAFTSPGELWFSPEGDAKFEIRSRTVDYAGNKENKPTADVVVTFDRLNPNLELNTIDKLTGSDELRISVKSLSENLSHINLEYARLTEGTDDVLDWVPIESQWQDNEILISPLINGYTYYFRANPVDLAGNDNSREPYEYTVMIESNHTEKLELPVLPLKPIMIGKIRNIEMTVDEDGDGIFEKSLEEYTGNDLGAMKANQYWVNYGDGEIVFGDGQDGYKPPANSSLSIIFQAFDLETTIDVTLPDAVVNVEFVIEDRNNVTISWNRPIGAVEFLFESRENFTRPWITLDNTSDLNYKLVNLTDGLHYYRIISIDRMGYPNSNMVDEYLEIFIEPEVNNIVKVDKETNGDLYTYIGIGVVLASIAAYTALNFIKGKTEDELPEGPILVPVDDYATGESETITEEESSTFSVVKGSQFSRQVMFICETGCKSEFELDGDDDEIMCPHCGTMGNSPL
jgi:hypothetical protein